VQALAVKVDVPVPRMLKATSGVVFCAAACARELESPRGCDAALVVEASGWLEPAILKLTALSSIRRPIEIDIMRRTITHLWLLNFIDNQTQKRRNLRFASRGSSVKKQLILRDELCAWENSRRGYLNLSQ
jgi:hypothetical protein